MRLEDKITENPGTLPYPHMVGSPPVRPDNMTEIVSRSVKCMDEQVGRQLSQIEEQVRLLYRQAKEIAERREVSYMIYSAKIGFTPVIGHTYHLYRNSGGELLSMISPEEWGKNPPYEFLYSVRLLGDHTWDIDNN